MIAKLKSTTIKGTFRLAEGILREDKYKEIRGAKVGRHNRYALSVVSSCVDTVLCTKNLLRACCSRLPLPSARTPNLFHPPPYSPKDPIYNGFTVTGIKGQANTLVDLGAPVLTCVEVQKREGVLYIIPQEAPAPLVRELGAGALKITPSVWTVLDHVEQAAAAGSSTDAGPSTGTVNLDEI